MHKATPPQTPHSLQKEQPNVQPSARRQTVLTFKLQSLALFLSLSLIHQNEAKTKTKTHENVTLLHGTHGGEKKQNFLIGSV